MYCRGVETWHKTCFKCWECGMILNMNNYKGYQKLPYCNAHYPKTSFTAVADTPEMQRLAQNTKLQSQIKYHADFEKDKGKYTVVTDEPELKRVLANQQQTSLINYHQEFEKNKDKYTPVADDAEMQRILKMQDQRSLLRYHEDFESNIKGKKLQVVDDPETLRHKQLSSIISNVEYQGHHMKQAEMEARRNLVDTGNYPANYTVQEPVPDYGGEAHQPSPYQARTASSSTMYNSEGKVEQNPARNIGSIADYDPVNDRFGSLSQGYAPKPGDQHHEWEETVPETRGQGRGQGGEPPKGPLVPINQPLSLMVQHPEERNRTSANAAPGRRSGTSPAIVYQAMYDYDAQDNDEVSFKEGDIVINCQPIDEGWMFGTIQRSNKRGMLPANYVERVQ
ncbi:LIM and SH3 domain protein F42H10.3 [Lamellibrachia satsuma]|nr:LIM and SH3 domain protein F42H10.3 [Lamellibrachia satsuma]